MAIIIRLALLLVFTLPTSPFAFANQGGVPNGGNGNNGNNGNGNNGNGNNGNGGQGQQGGQGGQGAQAGQAAVIAASIAKANANAEEVALTNAAMQSTITNTAMTLRGLIVNPRSSFDLWANSSAIFDKLNIATISAGFDYRIMPKWAIGMTSNWTMGRHIKGSAMNFGPYTVLSQWGAYLLASELINQEPEKYITFGQVGYNFQLGELLTGPFYAAQYNSKDHTVLNQAGLWALRPIGRWGPEVQVMYQGIKGQTLESRRESIWAGATLNYEIKDNFFISGGYNFEGNKRFQTNQITIGFKAEF